MYKYFANQLQIWLVNVQNYIAFCYAMLNYFFPDVNVSINNDVNTIHWKMTIMSALYC